VTRAAIYARISKDREGAGLGVERQEADCRALASTLGARIVEPVRVDNDLSAYSGKPRPGYLALLDDVRRGRVDVVLTWHTDRLHRSPVELEEWIDAAQVHGVAVHTVKAGPIDLATPSGRMVARQLGAVARYEVEHAIERQKAAKAQAAAAGKYRGGRRPFGYESDGVTVREDEAVIVRDVTARALRGEAIRSITRDLNERQVPTTLGGRWTPVAMRKMLLRARDAGLVEHEGEIVGEAEWPALVDPAQWRNLRRMLTDPARRSKLSPTEVYLGSGVYLCGVCDDGTPMIAGANTTTKSAGKRTAYRCRSGFHLTRTAGVLDDYITAVVIERLTRPDARNLLAPEERRVDVEALHTRRDDVDGRLTELAELFASGVLTGPQLSTATARLRAEREQIEAELSAAAGVSPLDGFVNVPDVRAAWGRATVGRRKAVVRALMTITVMPAPKGRPPGWQSGDGPYFDPTAIRIEWRS
jgi:DNA invertase Pin-like site-specific DNA recombinase